MSTAIVIPTWNNHNCLVTCVESILDYTRDSAFRLIVVDNGSQDDTPRYLEHVWSKVPSKIRILRNDKNLGFIKATNQGLKLAEPSENVLWLNDDVQIVDPYWLARMEDHFRVTPGEGGGFWHPEVGAVGPVSNYVMGWQQVQASTVIPKTKHFTNFLIGFCLLVRADAFAKVGFLDERFGLGGNDDLDYSIRLAEVGYRLLIEREVFVLHYGCQTIGRLGGYDKFEPPTRKLLVEKWGQARVDKLFEKPEGLEATP